MVDRTAWQKVAWEGEKVGLGRLPIRQHFAVDVTPCITALQIVARDPETKVCVLTLHLHISGHHSRLPNSCPADGAYEGGGENLVRGA